MLSRRLLRIKVVKGLYAHLKSESPSAAASEREFVKSIDAAYDLYHQMLSLIVDVEAYALKRIEIGLAKKLPAPEELNPNRKFVENGVIRRIALSKELSDYMKTKKLGWERYPELIKSLYNLLVESDFYKEYMESGQSSFSEDVRLVENFYEHIVVDNEAVEEAVEEQSVFWADDIDFAVIMVLRTISDCNAKSAHLPLLPKFRNDLDRAFAMELFHSSLQYQADYLSVVDKFTRNWDIERIAFLDNIIMTVAIAELIAFDSIPVKVTLDEFIEISKYYSTPGSGQFINGVLDKVVEYLQAEGKILKQGRGLL